MMANSDLSRPPPLPSAGREKPIALFIDFDGTLVEIAARPDAIVVPDGLAKKLELLAERLSGRLAIVSGRSLDDLSVHLGPKMAVARAGSHGAAKVMSDSKPLGSVPEPLPAAVVNALQEFAASHQLRYEAKTHGGALHYRENPAAGDDANAFAASIATRHGLALKTGKCVIELVHPGADKGSAVRSFMKTPEFAGATPVFIGDDATDEDGFRACTEMGGFGVLVGDTRETEASYRLASVGEVYQWLGL